MIFGLDISTSITGFTVLNDEGEVIVNEAWDLRKYKNIFEKASIIKEELFKVHYTAYMSPKAIFIEQSLQSFRSGFSSAKTLSTLSRFNGIVSWMCFSEFGVEPEYIAATSARKAAGVKVPRGVKGKEAVLKYVLDNVPAVSINYTRFGNPRPECYDKADSWVIARAGWSQCQQKKS